MDYYRLNPVDLFINTSLSEGGCPVGIVEALSFGIPIIATNIGGNPETVNSKNGVLLPANPKPKEIANAIFKIISETDNTKIQKMRTESYKLWEKTFNADKLCPKFSKELVTLTASQEIRKNS